MPLAWRLNRLTVPPQDFLNGKLSNDLSLVLAVTRQASGTSTGLETKTFTATTSARQYTSLSVLITEINSAISTAASAAGLLAANAEIPVLDIRGSNVRLGLRPATGSRLNPSLALSLNTTSSSGLNQLGSFTASSALQAVTPATVLSGARSTSLAIGSANKTFSSLQWDGGVRSTNADSTSSVSWSLRPASTSATQNLNAPIDAPVVSFTPDAGGGAVGNLLANFYLLGRTKTFEITQAADLTLRSLADVSAAPNLTNLVYKSTAGALTITGSGNSASIPSYVTSAGLTLAATNDITIGQGSNALQIKVPNLSLSTSGTISIGSGADLQASGVAENTGFSFSGSAVSIAGGLSTANASSTSITATSGSLTLASSARLSGLKGSQIFTATGASSDLIQASALGNDSLSAAIILSADRNLSSSASITTGGAVSFIANAGNISSAEEIYTTSDNVLVDKLGYRVNSAGAFIDGSGNTLTDSEKPLYYGIPYLPFSGGSIRASSFTANAPSGSITLNASAFPAGTPAVTSLSAQVSSFSDDNDQFTITGHGLSTGTAVRFYGVQDGALLPLVDGGLYYVIRTSANSFKLAGSSADASNGFAIPLSLAASITSGNLASFSPQVELGSSSVSLSARSIAISGNIQTHSFTATATAGDLGLLEEAWISTDLTSLATPAANGLLIDRTRTDLRRAILSASSLSLPSSGSFTLKGFLDLVPTSSGTNTTLSFPGSVTITGELTSTANLSLNVAGALNISKAGSIETSGDLVLNAGSFNLDADATRPGWELSTAPTSVTAVTSNQSVAVGSSLAAQNLAFTGDVKLVIDSVADILSYVGVDGSPLPHGLLTGDILYYQNGGSNSALGRAGLLNTNTSDPTLATAYSVELLDANRFQLKRNNVIIDLSSTDTGAADALVGLDTVDTQVETSTTQLTEIGTQQVQVGNEWITYDLSLNQDAFYRPATGEIREYFVPGVDFTVGLIPWESYNTEAPASNNSQGLGWDQYSTAQRNAVLDYLGYKPLYAANFNNINLNKNQNGVPTTTAIDNPWASGTNKIWLPSSGNLAGMAIVGTTDGLAKVVSNETFEGASSTATQGWTFAAGTTPVLASGGTPASPSTGTNTSINYFSQFLGTFANGTETNGQDAWKTFELDGNGGTVSFDLYRIDSWDGEKFRVYANDQIALETSLGLSNVTAAMNGTNNNYEWTITPKSDYDNHYGVTASDQTFRVSISVPAGVSSLKLGFGSTLDEPTSDEAYGIDALSVANAPDIYSTTSTTTTATQALRLDGVNDYADLPDISLGGDLTVEAWLYMNSAQSSSGTSPRIVDIGDASTKNDIILASYQDTGRIAFDTYTNGVGNGPVVTDEALPTNRWVHVAAVLNNDKSVQIYWDGVLKKSGTQSALPTEMVRTNTWVGRSNWSGGAYFNGSIRDLKIWNDARSSAEVRSDMSLSPSGSDNALAAWYPLSNVESGMGGVQDLSLQGGASITTTTGLGAVDANGNSSEWIGTSFDTAKVLYTQNRSALTASTLSQTISTTTLTGVVSDLEPFSGSNTGGSEWRVGYDSNGNRTYSINGLRSSLSSSPQISNATISRLPDWYDNSTYTSAAYPGTGPTTAFGTQKGNAPFILGYSQRPDLETFGSAASGWATPSGTAPITSSSYYGSFMGPFANGSEPQDVWKTYNLKGDGGQISFTLNRLDSWQGEFHVYANDQVIFKQSLRSDTIYNNSLTSSLINGYSVTSVPRNDFAQHYGNSSVNDQSFDISLSIPVGVTSLKLGFGSTPDPGKTVEAYGIDNLTVINASQNPGLNAPSDNREQKYDYIKSTASLANRSLVINDGKAGIERLVGSIPKVSNGYLASSGSLSNTDAYSKSEGLSVTTKAAAGETQNFNGYSRLARFTNPDEVALATEYTKSLGLLYAVDGYQTTDSNFWRYFDGQLMSENWQSTNVYIFTPSTSWTEANNISIGYDGLLVKVDNLNENNTLANFEFSNAWIGASRPSFNADFVWADNSALSYENWNTGEPNNSPNLTKVFTNDFLVNGTGSSDQKRYTINSTLGTILGRFGNMNGTNWDFSIGTDWSGGALDTRYPTQIEFDFLRLDSWDNESFYLKVEGVRSDQTFQAFEGNKTFAGNTEEKAAIDLIKPAGGISARFEPKTWGQLNSSSSNDQIFKATVTLPAGFSKYKLYFDGRTNGTHTDESYGIDNFIVYQNIGESFAAMKNNGYWNDLPSTSDSIGIAEVFVPNLRNKDGLSLWEKGQPNDGGGSSKLINEENYLGFNGLDGTFSDNRDWLTNYLSQVSPIWGPARDLRETFYDYNYDWTSVSQDVIDVRNNYRYSTTSTITPIYETQPLYHQEDVTSVATVSQLASRQVNQTVYQTQAVTTGVATTYSTDFRLSDAVPFTSIKGNSVNINIIGSSPTELSGNITANAATSSANGVNLGVTSVGAINLGNGARNSVTTTLLANSLAIKGSGISLANDVLISGNNGTQPQTLSLDAGAGVLSLQSSLAPVAALTLKGNSLALPVSSTTAFWANSLSLDAGARLSVSQPEANAQLLLSITSTSAGDPSALSITAGDSSTTQTFDNPLTAWSTAATYSSVPLLTGSGTTTALGRFANGSKSSNQDVWSNLNFSNAGGTISFDLLRLDSWDNEAFKVFANDTQILSTNFTGSSNETISRSGNSNGYSWTITPVANFGSLGGSSSFSDQTFRVSITVPAGVSSLKLGFGSTLNEVVDDESYGIDNFTASTSIDQMLLSENFESKLAGWQQSSAVLSAPISLNSTANGGIGNVLGMFANGPKTNGQDIWRNFSLSGDGGKVSFDLYRLDSWENEAFSIYANDAVVVSTNFQSGTSIAAPISGKTASGYSYLITPLANATNFYGNSSWNDQAFRVSLDIPAGVTSLKLGFGSNLDSPTSDESYAIDNFKFSDPGSLVINALSSSLPLVINAAGSVSISGNINAAAFDMIAGSLSSSSGASYSGSGALNLRLTGANTSDLSSLTLSAPSVNLDSQAGGIFIVNSPAIKLASRNSLSVTQAGTGSTSLSVNSSAGNFSFTSPDALNVTELNSGIGSISLTASSGDISLGSVSQTRSGSLALTASGGKVIANSTANRSIGALSAVARDGINIQVNQLRSFSASTTGAGSDIYLSAASPGSIAIGKLSADDLIDIANSQGALQLTDPAGISAASFSLTAEETLQIASSKAVTLAAANSLKLSAKNIDADLTKLTFETQAGGSTWLDFEAYSFADAIKLPLIDSANLTLESPSGVRLRLDAFAEGQQQKPFTSISFVRKQNANDLVALHHPYLNNSQLLLGSDNHYYGYTSSKALQTHFDAATNLYRYTALIVSSTGVSLNLIAIYSSDYQLTADNLASAILPAGVTASQVLTSTIAAVFRPAIAGITVKPAEARGKAIADAVNQVANADKAVATGSTSNTVLDGYEPIDQTALISQLIKSGYIIAAGSTTSSPLLGADVWLDLNRNFRKDADEPSASTNADGGFTLAISASVVSRFDSNGDGKLNDEHLRLISSGGIDSLTNKSLADLMLIADYSNTTLTPVTTLAALLADAGVSAATSAAIQRAYGVAVVDQADHSTAYNPYVNLATGGSEAISQVLAHTRLSGLFLLASSLGRHGGSSPMESLQRMAAALAKGRPTAPGASVVDQRQALMEAILLELGTSLSASQRQAIATVSETVSAELDALQFYAERYAEAGFSPRALLPAVSSLKALLTTVFTESLPQVLTGSLSIEQLQQRFAAQLAAGAHDSLPLDNDHLVAVTSFQQGRLQAGGAATFLISVASPAPAQGLRLIYSLEAPEGSTIQDSQSGSGRHQPAAISEFSIPAGRRSTTFTIQLPDRLADPIAQISFRLRYADSGFAINPEAASAEYFIDSLDPSATGEAPRSVAGSSIAADSLTGSEGPDRIDAGWGADSIDGLAGNDQLNGEGGSDSIRGGSGADRLDGGSGDDSLRGGSGRDILHGAGGDDHLDGEEGDDKLDGGEGNDLLDGGQGSNVFIGGRGADRFVLKSPGSELDLIVDFDPLKGDQFVVLSSRYPDAESQDFAIIGGYLLFRGTSIALVENNGRNFGGIRDITPYLLFTDTATTKPQPTTASPTAGSTSTSVSPSSLQLLATASADQERTKISNAAVLLANEARGKGLSLRPARANNGSTPSGIILSGESTSTILVDFSTLNAQELTDSQTTFLLYRVNRSGALLSPDGSTTVSSLDAAVIGSLGAVDDDAGRSLFSAGVSQVELSTGQELRFAISRRNQTPLLGGKLQINETNGELVLSLSSIGATTPDLILRATIASQVSSTTQMAIAQKAGLGDLLYLNNGEILDVSLASSCGNTNTYAFVKVELSTDAQGKPSFYIVDATGKAIPMANTDEFRAAIRSNLAAGFSVAQGGTHTTFHTWTVADGSGFYAPVMFSQKGDIYFIGSLNADGRQHIKPVGDGAFCFEDLSGSDSDFDYNDGVLHLSRRVAGNSENRSVVMAPASHFGTAIYLNGRTNYHASNASQLIHSDGLGDNVITTSAADDIVVLYSSKDRVQLEAGSDRVHILSGSSQNSIDFGADADADLVYFYRPKAGQGTSSLINFDVNKDIISLINLDITSSISFAFSGGRATLSVDSKPLLELVGDFSVDRLEAAIRRSDLGTSDALTSIAERGLLVADMIPGLFGTAEQRSDGLWYGYSVDLARTISEQLTGSADLLAIRSTESLLSGFREVSGGYADVALHGSSDISLGVDSSEPYLLDMQSFLVNGLSNAAQLADQTIGVIAGSSAKANALTFLNSNGINAAILEFTSSTELAEALRTHAIAAIASERTRLMDYKARIPGSTLLEETFSSQPLTVVLPENQKRLKDAVSAIVEVPAAAENLGIEPSDLPNLIAQSERGGSDFNAIDPQVREFLDLGSSPDSSSSLGRAVGLAKGFTQRVLARLGNASDLWKRHFP